MTSTTQTLGAAVIACCLTIPGYSQSTTIEEASENPATHTALLQKIERDRQEVVRYKVGHVIVGRIQLEGTDDPETVRSQMIIEADGFFSDAIRDLDRPIAFRKSGYRPLDFTIPVDTTPDGTGVIDVGTIRLEKCAPSEFRQAFGTISLQGNDNSSAAQVTLHLSGGPANTPHNGTEGVRKSDPPIEAKVDKAGVITADGLTEGEYYVTFSSPGFVGQSRRFQVSAHEDLDLGSIRLEKTAGDQR